ncbi:hypothetical protein ACRAWF_42995 [Streptomyces sp. L7]
MSGTAVRSERLDPAVLRLAGILLLGALAPILDSTIVSIAIHTLGHDLHASTATVQWVSTAYLLAVATVIPVSGWPWSCSTSGSSWLGCWPCSCTGSLLCGLAWNSGSLIVFRDRAGHRRRRAAADPADGQSCRCRRTEPRPADGGDHPSPWSYRSSARSSAA